MRIATWNVNSLKARMARVEEWIDYAQPDILCLQETKLADSAFPAMAFQTLGYDSVHLGEGRWNGVAILSRVGIDGFHPGFSDGGEVDPEARLAWATCGGVRVGTVYVPNGRSVGSEHYEAKLRWLERLALTIEGASDPRQAVVVCGDFNVAPEDRDVWDTTKLHGNTHVSDPERAAVGRLMSWGLRDVFRECRAEDRLYSWWDYRAGDFHQHRGLRIDLILATAPLADKAEFALIDRFARKGKLPSDHAPVLVDFEV